MNTAIQNSYRFFLTGWKIRSSCGKPIEWYRDDNVAPWDLYFAVDKFLEPHLNKGK